MATIFSLGPVGPDGLCPIKMRVQCRVPAVDIKQQLPFRIRERVWNSKPGSLERQKYCHDENINSIFIWIDEIRQEIAFKLEARIKLSAQDVRDLVQGVIYREQIRKAEEEEAERRRLEELANKMTFRKFFDMFLTEASEGIRLTESGTIYSKGTLTSIKQAHDHLRQFEEEKRKHYDFEEIDMSFYNEYNAFLNKKNYALNTIGKNINWLKTVLSIAESEGYNTSSVYKDKRFKGSRVEVDSIYLPISDIDKIRAVNLTDKAPGFEIARDLFLIGIWTAQRVSDYNNIKRENIRTYKTRNIEDVVDPTNPNRTKAVIVEKDIMVIDIYQTKTGAHVMIPCSTELKLILEKYDYCLPHLSDQNINDNIKKIAEWAGLDEKVRIEKIKGGKKIVEWKHKYDLVHTHTARRTGATLMYLSGMDIYDIMRITGHSSPQTLKKYIKANELEVVDKIVNKYDYFD